jgi:hypothetical protein
MRLPKTKTINLTKSKLKSLAKKYSTIPPEHQSYYPDITDYEEDSEEEEEEENEQEPVNKRKKTKKKAAPGARTVGRPKKSAEVDGTQPSLLRFWKVTEK